MHSAIRFELFQEFAGASSLILFQFDLSARKFLFLSSSAEGFLGFSKKALMADPEPLYQMVVEDEVKGIEARKAELLAGKAVNMAIRFSSASSLKYVKVQAHLVHDALTGADIVTGIAEDITKEAEYEIYLLEYARRKNSVLSIVAHDLKAPLAHIQSAATLLRDEQARKPTEVLPLFEIIERSCQDSIDLITELLHDEHIKSPAIFTKKDRLNVPEMAERVLVPFRAVNKLGHQFMVKCPETRLIAELDEMKFTQILNNLVVNSVKFTPAGGTICIEVQHGGSELRIIHSDTGIGIPEKLQPLIFDRYNKASRPGLRGEKSTGVGLSIVRQLVEVQGGRIWVESKEDEGARFYLTFPLLEK